mgnify:CR=1 FL=1|jgi:hypothetical protein
MILTTKYRFALILVALVSMIDSVAATLLFIGDSTMRSLCNSNWGTYKARNVFGNETVLFVGIAGVVRLPCGSMPSHCNAQLLLRQVPGLRSNAERAAVRAVYLNFAAMHTLHVFPHLPWWWNTPEKKASDSSNHVQMLAAVNTSRAVCGGQPQGATKNCHFADYEGFARMERWMRQDIAAYREALPNAQIVIATPNWVCNDRYYSSYKWLTATSAGVAESARSCAQFMREHAEVNGWPKMPNLHTACREGQQSGNGTVALALRMRRLAQKIKVSVVDWTALTLDQCVHTKDGRHYDKTILRQQLLGLQREISGGWNRPQSR